MEKLMDIQQINKLVIADKLIKELYTQLIAARAVIEVFVQRNVPHTPEQKAALEAWDAVNEE